MSNTPPQNQESRASVTSQAKRKLPYDAESTPQSSEKRLRTGQSAPTVRAATQPNLPGLDPSPRLDGIQDPFLGTNGRLLAIAASPNTRQPSSIVTAGDVGMLDPSNSRIWFQQIARSVKVAKLIYVIHHYITEPQFAEYIALDTTSAGPAYQDAMDACRKNWTSWQSAARKFFVNGVFNTRELFVKKEFDSAPATQRGLIWEFLFNRAPINMTRKMLGATASVIDIDEIFLGQDTATDTRRSTFATCFRMMFAWSCENVVAVAKGKERREFDAADNAAWHHLWRDVTQSERWNNAVSETWNFANIPVIRPEFSGRGRVSIQPMARHDQLPFDF